MVIASQNFDAKIKDLSADCYRTHRELNETAKKIFRLALYALALVGLFFLPTMRGKLLSIIAFPIAAETVPTLEFFEDIPHTHYFDAGHDLLGQRFQHYLRSEELDPNLENILEIHKNYKETIR